MAGTAGRDRRQPLAGRAGEVREVVSLARGAVGGQAGTLVISGAAGVGKTALAREACSVVSDIADILWGSCLPLSAVAVPYLPLAEALRQWAADRDVSVPALLGSDAGQIPAGPLEFDAWLEGACRRRPMMLVVDDLHWADQSSLDALLYVIAGPPGRRLAVLATMRDGEVGEGHPLRRWLADARRLPRVAELHLGPLDRVATGEQMAGLLGQPPHQALVDEVFGRTRGNAYLTALLVRNLAPDATALPPGLPTALREAAERAWHGLSAPARELTRLLAVAGRPQRGDELAEVANVIGFGTGHVPLLREAVNGGVLEVNTAGTYWFVHPLLAEALEEGLLPEERRARHAAFAGVMKRRSGPGQDLDVEWAIALADHYHLAGHRDEAYHWALLGAETAEQAGGAAEMLRLLRRAVDLWPGVVESGVSRLDLLQRLRLAAERAGQQAEELATVDDLLAAVDRDRQPLLAAWLLVRRMHLRFSTGVEFASLADVREAVRISASYPGSAEHALATAELAHAELWHAEPTGPARAGEAVRLARACGSAEALAYALTAHVMARIYANDADGVAVMAEEAVAAAAEARDFWAFVHAGMWLCNSLDGYISPQRVERYRRLRDEMASLGAPHTYVAWLSADEALALLHLGDWRACMERLRVVLGSTPGPMGDVIARLAAAQLASRQGRQAEGEAHLARAEELFAEQSAFLAFPFDAVRAELALAAGDSERAFAAAQSGAEQEGVVPTLAERLIPLAARAAADQAQTLRDRADDPAPALARLRELRSRHPTVLVDAFGPGPMYHLQVHAMQAWYDAEVQRAQAHPEAGVTWRRAAAAFADAGLLWDEAYAWWRAAEALLPIRSARHEAAGALRRAYKLAVELEAVPLREDVRALAGSARISLASIPAEQQRALAIPGLPDLTPREREVLAYIVAGRTYREIAHELVVSEKTVSVHVSNLLRKTGTANRMDLTQRLRRLAGAATPR